MTNKHPSSALLRRYATGDAGQGESLALTAHLSFCAECRAKVVRFEMLAGALLSGETPKSDGLDYDALEALLNVDAPASEAKSEVDAGPLPRPVAEAIGCDFARIPWKFRLPGVYEHEFMAENGETISLLKVRPGAAIPKHTHKAEELTVVFDGELIDGEQRYAAGDIAVADGDVDHNPKAGGDRDCICLAVLSGGLTFTGPFGRALNLFS